MTLGVLKQVCSSPSRMYVFGNRCVVPRLETHERGGPIAAALADHERQPSTITSGPVAFVT